MRLKLSRKQLETIGSCSVSGLMVDHPNYPEDKELILVFEESSELYRRKNDGPELLVIPEHVPFCLIQNILILIERGYSVKVETEISDPQ